MRRIFCGIDSTSIAFAAKTCTLGGRGPAINSVRDISGGGLGNPAAQSCLLLLFPRGGRPAPAEVRAALARSATGQVAFDPAESTSGAVSGGWLEVVVDGLTFDLGGLSPGPGLLAPPPRHCFGLTAATLAGCEAIGLAPGPHLAAAAHALPVVRTILRLSVALVSQMEAALGTVWLPAGSAIRRELFVGAVNGWLASGPFPALGLLGAAERPGGAVASDGLSFFTGQELHLDPSLVTDQVAATQLMARLVDHLLTQPALAGEARLRLEDGRNLHLMGVGPTITVSLG